MKSPIYCFSASSFQAPSTQIYLLHRCMMFFLFATFVVSCFVVACSGAVIDIRATEITSDTFFYGQSPPVYPSRKSCLHQFRWCILILK